MLHKIQKVIIEQDNQMKAQHEYRMDIKKSLAGEPGGLGDMQGRGYLDMDKKGPRSLYTDRIVIQPGSPFDTISHLPKIASKYKNSDQGFKMETMSKRDPNFMIKESFGNLLSNEQKGFKPFIKGNVSLSKMTPRKPLMKVD